MIRSMTGYGQADAQTSAGRFLVEVRSVNHRFVEVQVRMPRDLTALEDQVRQAVQERVLRGRVEVSIMREDRGARPRTVQPDTDLAVAYAQALAELARVLGVSGEVSLSQIAAFPDVVRVEESRADVAALWGELAPAVATAVDTLVEMRGAEGRRLASDLGDRLNRMEALTRQVEARAGAVVADYATRLQARVRELLGGVPVDESRLMTELAVFAERSDIAEELTRLRSHLTQFGEDLTNSTGAIGRKLEFVLQEMGRETNTIGAKANDVEIARAVIALKGELESLREQIQNIE